MSDLAYIDSYFNGELNAEELGEFEQRIREDAAFAEEVAFYCEAMVVTRNQWAEEKKKEFRRLYEQHLKDSDKPGLLRRLWPYIAAAAVIAGLIFGTYFYLEPASPKQQADQFIRRNFEIQMGTSMAGRENSSDSGMRLYNENKLPEALQQFEKMIQTDSAAALPRKMAGIVSLRTGDYDKAIEYFTQLENLTLYSNPGKFYHALALIKRNRPEDKEKIKQLLEQVMEQGLEGNETAKKWMESF